MERLRHSLTGPARLAVVALAAAAGAGCTTTQQASFKTSITDVVSPAKPATEFAVGWQNRLAQLPDQTRNGVMVPGVVGQMFLYDFKLKPVEGTGDLTLTVHDATTRPQGVPGVRSEVWHFTRETLKNMSMTDERFGRAIVLFLPWPEHWRDVNRVYIQGRYDQVGGNTLYAQPATVTLDFSPGAPGSTGPNGMPTGMPAVPDPAVLLKQARAATATQHPGAANALATAPAGGFGPHSFGTFPQGMQQPGPQQTAGMPYQQTPAWGPQPSGGFVPPNPGVQQTNYGPYPPAGYPQPQQGWPANPQPGQPLPGYAPQPANPTAAGQPVFTSPSAGWQPPPNMVPQPQMGMPQQPTMLLAPPQGDSPAAGPGGRVIIPRAGPPGTSPGG